MITISRFFLPIPKLAALVVQDKESKNKQQNEYTGKHNFCHMKTNVCFICIFHTEFKYVIRIALSPKFCVTEFLKCNFSEFHYFLCYQYIINMAEALYYILNIVWASKLNHNKDSKHVCPIKDSQTVGT